MITIVHDGISETRHCRDITLRGWLLDADKERLQLEAVASLRRMATLIPLGVIAPRFQPELFFDYFGPRVEARYHHHIAAELKRAREIATSQELALAAAITRLEIQRKLEALRSKRNQPQDLEHDSH